MLISPSRSGPSRGRRSSNPLSSAAHPDPATPFACWTVCAYHRAAADHGRCQCWWRGRVAVPTQSPVRIWQRSKIRRSGERRAQIERGGEGSKGRKVWTMVLPAVVLLVLSDFALYTPCAFVNMAGMDSQSRNMVSIQTNSRVSRDPAIGTRGPEWTSVRSWRHPGVCRESPRYWYW